MGVLVSVVIVSVHTYLFFTVSTTRGTIQFTIQFTLVTAYHDQIPSQPYCEFFFRIFWEYTSEMEESWSAAPAVPKSISLGAPRGFVPNTPMLRASVTVIYCLGYSESSLKREGLERRPGSPRHRYRWTPRTILRVRELSVDQSALLSFLGTFWSRRSSLPLTSRLCEPWGMRCLL